MKQKINWIQQFKYPDESLLHVILAYAAGDAFGAFYEFNGRHETIPNVLKAKDSWPFGGVSDDTLLTLLTIQSMESERPGHKYLELIRKNLNNLRGLGPTTRSALGLDVKPDERGEIGNTNGAMMRSALCGLANFSEQSIIDVIKVTHSKSEAIEYSLAMVELFRGSSVPDFPKPKEEVGLSPKDTYEAVCYVVNHSNSVASAYANACALGGDTDTVAALSGALFLRSFKDPNFQEIDWLSEINWSEVAVGIDSAVEVLRKNS